MSETMKPVRVRFAPSPTGRMHLGSARTALYDYLLARRTGGTFILRIEDTDTKRTVPGSERELMDGLRWMGIEYNEGPDIGGPCGPYRQSERREIYHPHAWELVGKSAAYPCFCAADRLEKVRQERQKQKLNTGYDGFCRNLDPDEARRRVANGEQHVIRFMSPRAGTTSAVDLLRG
ncbi:MAG: glutamate--tRNA ligase family protein, partial [Anaerolineales bacterium]|nr:glutamate--tRNA ligase family protein [Anaerolineales bacterium]